LDIEGQMRIIAGVVDMGACELITSGAGAPDPSGPRIALTGILTAYPNPFNPTITVAFEFAAAVRFDGSFMTSRAGESGNYSKA
jgi:hypothetical protein